MVRAPRRLASRIGGERIGRLARLGDADHQRPVVHHGVPIAELRGVLHLDRDPGHLLQHVLADQRRVPRGAAGGDDDPLDLLELVVAQVEAADARRAFLFQQVAAERVAEALGLLADLFQHEVGVAVPLHLSQVPVDLVDRLADPGGLQVPHPVAVAGEHHHLAVVEVDHRAGVLQQRRSVRRDEPLVLAHADQERGSLAGRHQHAGLVRRDEGETVGAVHFAQRRGDRLFEVALVELAHQVGQHLGVGLGREAVAPALESLPDRAGVLDDAVVDDGDAARLVGVGMRVGRGRRAVGGPAGVTDADRAGGHAPSPAPAPAWRACPPPCGS